MPLPLLPPGKSLWKPRADVTAWLAEMDFAAKCLPERKGGSPVDKASRDFEWYAAVWRRQFEETYGRQPSSYDHEWTEAFAARAGMTFQQLERRIMLKRAYESLKGLKGEDFEWVELCDGRVVIAFRSIGSRIAAAFIVDYDSGCGDYRITDSFGCRGRRPRSWLDQEAKAFAAKCGGGLLRDWERR